MNCNKFNKVDVVFVVCFWFFIVNENLVVDIILIFDIIRNNEYKILIKFIFSMIVSSKDRLLIVVIIILVINNVFLFIFFVKWFVIWLVIIILMLLIVKNKLNCCGDVLYMFCNINGEFEMYVNIVVVINFCDNVYFINRWFFNNFLYVVKVFDKLFVFFFLGGNVLCNIKVVEINMNMLIVLRMMKILCYVVNCNNCFLIIGVKIGVVLFINISSEKNFVILEFEYILCIIVCDIIILVDFEVFCRKCNNINV